MNRICFYVLHCKPTPVAYNILYVIDPQEIKKMVKYKGKHPNIYNCIRSKLELRDYLDMQFKYYFWSKSEAEFLITPLLTNNDNIYKLDLYAQISPNLNIITDYVAHTLKLPFADEKISDIPYDRTFGLKIK